MPTIRIDCGTLTKEKKIELAEKMTKLCNEVMGIPEQSFTIYIRENSRDNISVGGKLLSMRDQQPK